MKKLSLVLCILWMGFIFYNSSQSGIESNNRTKDIIKQVLDGISGNNEKDNTVLMYSDVSQVTEYVLQQNEQMIEEGHNHNYGYKYINFLNILLRKGAHAFEFLILAILVALVMVIYEVRDKKAVVYVLLTVLIYAGLDEFHQLYVSGRTASIFDVFIDFIGGIVGTAFFYILKGKLNTSNKKILSRQ